MAWPDSKKQHQATGKIHTVDFGKRRPKRSKLCYRRDDWSTFDINDQPYWTAFAIIAMFIGSSFPYSYTLDMQGSVLHRRVVGQQPSTAAAQQAPSRETACIVADARSTLDPRWWLFLYKPFMSVFVFVFETVAPRWHLLFVFVFKPTKWSVLLVGYQNHLVTKPNVT